VDCYSCRQDEHLDTAPVRERIGLDGHWRVAHVIDSALPGWLVLVPRRHVTALADLTDDEAADLGHWQVRASRALTAVTGCVKTYVVLFAEAEGFSHVHFHIIPRMADQPDDRRGPAVFGYLNAPAEQSVTAEQQDEIAAAVAAALAASG
jgi:diadenosine tetraphosphate (Ap4A) HIT family hydrolase